MDSIKINPVSFKGAYKLKGSSEVLDEICWFLRRNKQKAASEFDFLDIRLVKKSETQTDRIIGRANGADIQSKDAEEPIVEHLLDLISIRNGTMAPFEPPVQKENVDLFLTQGDKNIAEQGIINMVEDSLANVFRLLDFGNKAKVLLENLHQMREGLYYGKPISNIKQSVAQNHLKYLNIPDIQILKAEDVFEKIKRGTFDIVNVTTYMTN